MNSMWKVNKKWNSLKLDCTDFTLGFDARARPVQYIFLQWSTSQLDPNCFAKFKQILTFKDKGFSANMGDSASQPYFLPFDRLYEYGFQFLFGISIPHSKFVQPRFWPHFFNVAYIRKCGAGSCMDQLWLPVFEPPKGCYSLWHLGQVFK